MLPRVVAEVAQLVEATIDTRGDDSAIAKAERRFRRQGGFNLLAHIAEFVQRLMKFLQPRAAESSQRLPHLRHAGKGSGQRQQIARIG